MLIQLKTNREIDAKITSKCSLWKKLSKDVFPILADDLLDWKVGDVQVNDVSQTCTELCISLDPVQE